jgi:Ca-activated chloride channel family protein
MRARLPVLLIVVSLLTALVEAQDRGIIVVTVTDQSRAVLPGATVRVNGPDQRTTISNDRGQATFVGLLPGTYQVTVELKGFATRVVSLSLRAGDTERLPVTLAVATLSESVAVAGTPPPPALGRLGGAAKSPVSLRAPSPAYWEPYHRRSGETYSDHGENVFRSVSAEPLSTFSIDVDTASYANVRRFLNEGTLPPEPAIRIEEMINYFKFDYPEPKRDEPFSITTELAACPWNEKHRLALVGLKGRETADKATPPRNLVFLIDVSGSMAPPDKLPLVRHGMVMLADSLTAKDRVAIVVYAGASGLALESTPGNHKERIAHAIERLHAGGSTNGGAGIQLAYKLARENFIERGVNRVILATDGDFNVGVTDRKELERLIERERESGVFLSVLGVGTGNINDATMELLADKGNGNYSYLDTMHEAHRVLVKEAGSTLVTIAKDVKIQVEFNPRAVGAYRLIGYENRMLRDRDFNDDRKDAGEIGAGHSVTAIYEIVPAGVEVDRPRVDPLKYSTPPQPTAAIKPARGKYDDELMTVKLRYKAPDGEVSQLTSAVIVNRLAAMTANLGFASAVAEAGMLLRNSAHAGKGSYASAIDRARKFRGDDPDGYRAEFARLIELAATLSKRNRTDR